MRRSNLAEGSQREEQILCAAAEMFRQHGYSATTLQDIADAVGVTKPSLYYYIEHKEDLLHRVLSEVMKHRAAIRLAVSAMSCGPIERIRECLRLHAEHFAQEPTMLVVEHYEHDRLTNERRRASRRERRRHIRFLAGLIEEAQGAGEITKAVDPELTATLILGGLTQVCIAYASGSEPSAREPHQALPGLALVLLGAGSGRTRSHLELRDRRQASRGATRPREGSWRSDTASVASRGTVTNTVRGSKPGRSNRRSPP